MVGFDPGRRRAEADGGEERGDLPDRERLEAIDDGAVGGPVGGAVIVVAEEVACERGLAAAGGADDEANVPVVAERRHVER